MAAIVQQVPDSAAPGKAANKAIFLFSDGTGNSSAKLFKTNVWRLYEALDLGPAAAGKQVQIAFYDNGVGTSAFRPVRWLGGIFGFGLKRNVLRLYTFLCRNYQPGDRIYVFWFSRGAYTIRILAALVASQGVLVDADEADLAYLVHDAYRQYCRQPASTRVALSRLTARAVRKVRDVILRLKRRLRHQKSYAAAVRENTDVEFVGVWDTVAAYGGPFAELTRGIDDWVWPLSLANYRLSPRVLCARHALSLDDERDAFWPLLWDEESEAATTKAAGLPPDRLKQVWFAGVHSDVGGGYPDESLSYSSLVWMMDELVANTKARPKNEWVRFIPQIADRIASIANALGPIHDSRAGLASYYRYQPRKIAAFLRAFRRETISMRDPQADAFLTDVRVHETVLARIVSGVDNYAPAALPATFIPERANGPYGRGQLSAAQLKTLTGSAPAREHRFQDQENEWDAVWKRRCVYFVTIFATLFLLALPSLPRINVLDAMCTDSRCFAPQISHTILFFLPQNYRGWLAPWARRPIDTAALLAIILGLIWWGQRLERTFRDSVRRTWNEFRRGKLKGKAPPPTPLRRDRESNAYQRTLMALKWIILPFWFGLLALASIMYGVTVVATQVLYAIVEPHQIYCSDKPDEATSTLDLSKPCTNLGVRVQRAHSYRVEVTVTKPWKDDWVPADPHAGAPDRTFLMFLGHPLKRVTNATWLQPVTEVRADQTGLLRRLQWLVGKDIELRRLDYAAAPGGVYFSNDLCPRRTGQLHMMVNDATMWLVPWPYWNNHGEAAIKVTDLGGPCVPVPERR